MQRNLGKESRYRIIGMMSGTSLDGVDLTCCLYWQATGWQFQLEAARTYPYPEHILASINVMQDVKTTFLQFKTEELSYSKFIAELVLSFIEEFGLQTVDYLSLHGHTIFHRPQQQLTVQMTNLSAVAALTRLDVIGNFRELDVLRGGQGAPLAPFGDQLFQGDVFINLGGVANIGCHSLGWDVMYCNLVFNHFALLLSGQNYDQGGQLGRKGVFRAEIAEFLEKQWQVQGQDSLEREKFQQLVRSLKDKFGEDAKLDILTSYYHFLANSIHSSISRIKKEVPEAVKTKLQVTCTGGGAHNAFLLELMSQKSPESIEFRVPEASTVEFKEAIIFGFLGVKFLENMANCSSGVGGCLVKGRVAADRTNS